MALRLEHRQVYVPYEAGISSDSILLHQTPIPSEEVLVTSYISAAQISWIHVNPKSELIHINNGWNLSHLPALCSAHGMKRLWNEPLAGRLHWHPNAQVTQRRQKRSVSPAVSWRGWVTWNSQKYRSKCQARKIQPVLRVWDVSTS